MDVSAHAQLINKLEGESIHVCHWEQGQHGAAFLQSKLLVGERDVRPHGTERNHHSLGIAGGSRGVVDDGELVGLVVEEMHVVGGDGLFCFRLLAHHGDVHHLAVSHAFVVFSIECRHDFTFDEHAGEQQFGIRMLGDIGNLLSVEIHKNRYCHGSVSDDGKEAGTPIAGVFVADGDFIPLLDSLFFKKAMHPPDGQCQVMEGESNVGVVVGKCREFPVQSDGGLKDPHHRPCVLNVIHRIPRVTHFILICAKITLSC